MGSWKKGSWQTDRQLINVNGYFGRRLQMPMQIFAYYLVFAVYLMHGNFILFCWHSGWVRISMTGFKLMLPLVAWHIVKALNQWGSTITILLPRNYIMLHWFQHQNNGLILNDIKHTILCLIAKLFKLLWNATVKSIHSTNFRDKQNKVGCVGT